MPVPEIFSAPNLISLTRVTMLPVMWYYLSQEGRTAVVFCAAIMAWAGISDALDGYLARRLNQVGKLGILLDPLCDKIFAVALVLMLIPYRDFPIWLAIVILGRDLLILLGGLYLNRKKPVSLPSNLVGKYAFAVMAMLLTSYVIEYPLGVWLFAPLTLAFIAASLVWFVGLWV